METEKIYLRDDGLKVKIKVSLHIDHRDIYWSISVEICQPKKRTWKNVHNADDYQWRRLNYEEREKHILETYLKYVTADEIRSAKLKLIENLVKTI